jgi:hypothetical protein
MEEGVITRVKLKAEAGMLGRMQSKIKHRFHILKLLWFTCQTIMIGNEWQIRTFL